MAALRQERARRTRERLLEVAAAEFARGGYEKTSLDQIMAASGSTKGAFYYHFDSKLELALACFRHKQEQLAAQVLLAGEGAGDALTALAAVMRERARVLEADPSMRAVLVVGAELRADATPGSQFADYQMLPIEAFARLVRRGQEEGTIRRELDARATGELIFAAMVGMDDVSRFLSDGTDLRRRSDDLVDVLVRGLAARPAPRRTRRKE